MNISIFGVTGGVGRRMAQCLHARGHSVTGIVRRPDQAQEIARQGVTATIADIALDPVATIAESIKGSDIVLFAAGAGGRDGHEATTAVDGDGPSKVAAAARIAGVCRFYFVSVFPRHGGRNAWTTTLSITWWRRRGLRANLFSPISTG
jgi:nucleoside-diphosphate-sugar epimerase